MAKYKTKQVSRNIGSMVLLAISLSIIFLAAAVYITQQTFSKVNETIKQLAEHDSKTAFLNEVYSTFGNFERNQQSPLLANPSAPSDSYFASLDSLKLLVDSTSTEYDFNTAEREILDSVSAMIELQNQSLLRFRIMKQNQQPLLEQNLDSLINLINSERLLTQADVVTTRKSTRRIPAETEVQVKPEEDKSKKNLFQRIFSSGEEEAPPQIPEKKPEIIEETYIQTDTVPLAKNDTSKVIAGQLIKKIERKQAYHQRRTGQIELDILSTGARIQNFILSLIRNSEEEELIRIHGESRIANNLMQTAISRMYLVFGIFAVLAILFVIRIMSDLTRAKYYRRELIEEKERAENLSKIKERFLANMSHEIRTPLQNISGYSERLSKNQHSADAKIIHQSSNHLLQIVNQVLDFSRISTGNLLLYPEVFSISELIDEVVSSMKIQAAEKEIRLLTETACNEDLVYADPFRIRQILYNLLGNAIKFTDAGFVKLSAESEKVGNKITFRFSVEDTGIGMDNEEIERLFEEFEQANTPNHATTGTGLGLSIVKALVEMYQGEISVTSNEGQGSRFDVMLEIEPIPEREDKLSQAAPATKMQRVLLVDDDLSILNLTRDILTDNNLDVTATASPQEAIEIAQKQTFDIALVDYRMPGMTGAELCTILKEIHPEMPVVAVTANLVNPKGEAGFEGNFDGYLPKPFKAKELLDILGYGEQKNGNNTRKSALDEKLATLTMGDLDAQKELLDQFKEDTKNDIAWIEKELDGTNLIEIREAVHRLSGRLGFFEFKKLASQFHQIENTIEQKDYTDETRKRLEHVLAELQTKLSEL